MMTPIEIIAEQLDDALRRIEELEKRLEKIEDDLSEDDQTDVYFPLDID